MIVTTVRAPGVPGRLWGETRDNALRAVTVIFGSEGRSRNPVYKPMSGSENFGFGAVNELSVSGRGYKDRCSRTGAMVPADSLVQCSIGFVWRPVAPVDPNEEVAEGGEPDWP